MIRRRESATASVPRRAGIRRCPAVVEDDPFANSVEIQSWTRCSHSDSRRLSRRRTSLHSTKPWTQDSLKASRNEWNKFADFLRRHLGSTLIQQQASPQRGVHQLSHDFFGIAPAVFSAKWISASLYEPSSGELRSKKNLRRDR